MAARQRTIAKDAADNRPTSRPPFDPAQFAQEAESRLRENELPASRTPTHRVLPATSAPDPPPPVETMRAMRAVQPSGPDLQVRQVVDADAVPRLIMSKEELEWFALSPTASRVVAQVDGTSTMHAVCLRADMSNADVLAIMLELAEQGIVAFG
jgi:hypothetical protein